MSTEYRSAHLLDYDESLLESGDYVPTADGFAAEEADLTDERYGRLWSTFWAVLAYIICVGVYLASLFWQFCEDQQQDFAIKVTGQVGLVVVAAGLEWYLRWKHRQRQRLGYLDFYQRVRKLQSVPLLAAGGAAATLLLALAWPDLPPAPSPALNRLRELQVITMAQAAVTLLFAVAYGYRVWQHASTDEMPDALRFLQAASDDDRCSLLGAKAMGEVEGQARVIHFMKKRCRFLQREVLQLKLKCNALREAGDKAGEAVRTDMAQLLAARERELRGSLADKEVLAQRNRQAALLLEQRSQALHEAQEMAAQQKEENERLRGNLEEWSKRNAKLELRLNALTQQLEGLRGPGPTPPDGPEGRRS
eukprot:jgi/Botrbrau1/23109/Bobra.0243s0043.1